MGKSVPKSMRSLNSSSQSLEIFGNGRNAVSTNTLFVLHLLTILPLKSFIQSQTLFLRNEKDSILHDLSELKLEAERLEKMKCLVRNCRYRRPPSEYMGVDFSDVFMLENKSKNE